MKFDIAKCCWCGSAMPIGAMICRSCGAAQRDGAASSTRKRRLIAIALSAAVLIAWNWFRTSSH
jgi:hypothetical protein